MKIVQFLSYLSLAFIFATARVTTNDIPTQAPLQASSQPGNDSRAVPVTLFASLEELSRIVDISYCIGLPPGNPGIAKPFTCLSRCSQFPDFELVTTFHTGLLLADACGYIALDHAQQRIIVAFRGTYSLMDAIIDLSTIPQEYVPYPAQPPNNSSSHRRRHGASSSTRLEPCTNCTVHAGFFASWQNTRATILPQLQAQLSAYQKYTLHFVGHSLGGAIAALAGLDALAHGWGAPVVTTFGEPRIGNAALAHFLATAFELHDDVDDDDDDDVAAETTRRDRSALKDDEQDHRPRNEQQQQQQHHGYRRITHIDDPVPLLPLSEWGYASHAGEVFISRHALPPSIVDLEICAGPSDPRCSDSQGRGSEDSAIGLAAGPTTTTTQQLLLSRRRLMDEMHEVRTEPWGGVPPRYRLWELFFAHRDYFWRLGLCVPGGDPLGGGGGGGRILSNTGASEGVRGSKHDI